MTVFAHMFDHMLEKEAVSKMDTIRMLEQSVKNSLFGSHGIKGVGKILSKPIKHSYEGFMSMNPFFQGLGLLGVGSAALGGEGGPAQRLGRTVGNVLPFALMAPGLGPKAPGFVGMMGAQEALGGGMLVQKGLMERGGEKVDEFLGFGKKPSPKFPAPSSMNQSLPQRNQVYNYSY